MVPKLPLHSARWRDLDGVTVEEVTVLLEEMAAATASATAFTTASAAAPAAAAPAASAPTSEAVSDTDDAWLRSWRHVADNLIHQGTVYDGAYAALPHLVEAATALSPGQARDFWLDMGLIVTAEGRPPVPADLEAGFGAALRLAERSAVRSFLAPGTPAALCAGLALSCVAFAGHHAATALWRFLDPRESHVVLLCPGCGIDTEIPEFFVDPVRPPFEAPGLPDPAHVRHGEHPWGEVAAVLQEEVLGEEWEPFLQVARAVAAAGVPPETPAQAVLCLVAGMVAATGTPAWAGREWARKLMLLTGCFRCPDCEQTRTIADGLTDAPDGAHHQGPLTQIPAAVDVLGGAEKKSEARRIAEAPTGLRRDGNALLTADGTPWGEVTVFAASAPGVRDGIDALAVIARPGRPTLVAGAGKSGQVCLWDGADGRLVHGPLPGHPDGVRSMTVLRVPLPPPDGRILLASGGEAGTIALWAPVEGQPIREPEGNWLGGVSGMCAATMPDGRTLLVTATSRGAVRLRDPATGESVARLNPYGHPVASIATVPISASHTLIAASDPQGGVHVWDPAVDDPWESGAAVPLSRRALDDIGHRVAVVAAVPTHGRTLLATGDRNGVVMLWDPSTGAPVGDGLPTDIPGSPLTAMTAATLLPGRRTVLVMGSGQGRNLRIWEPETGTVRHIALDVAVTCLAATGSTVVVGHDRGVLGVPLVGR
ncbi:hypothetical protein PV726_48540 [Streptomyces europaeiscabiei]|uniref:WD40 repeat domain-containing protein n=1 Tax=Streptomyces europaeiscabiei TaxID=146819 RepID=UPI0029B5FE8C|nr:hypothetical protein [Streptomyces europaeiscabiei]MDX3697878.1 hypothetical protein [Streptomyces europaeiscabiei]